MRPSPDLLSCVLSWRVVVHTQVFLWVFVAFYMALFTLYPRSGPHSLPQVKDMNSEYAAAFALLDLSFVGERVPINLLTDSFDVMSSSQVACATYAPLASGFRVST